MTHSSRWARSFAVGSLSLVTLFGCASIIGLDDYKVASQGAHAGTSATAGASGDAGARSQGEAGESGASQSGGGQSEAGQAGAPITGEGGEAGQPASPIVGCDGVTTFEPNEQIVTSCIIRGGCSPYKPVRTISTCVTYDTQETLPGENCTRKATTCAEYQECEHVGIAGDDLCGGSKKTRCDGNIAVNCGNYDVSQFSDCEALGGTCATYDYSGTIYADCKLDVSPDTKCATETDDTKFFCHDDLRYYCWDGEAYGASCSNLGYCEGDQDLGKSGCYFKLPDSCTGSGVSCKNNVAYSCSSGNLFKYDCGTMGLTCGITGPNEYCLAPGCKAADVDTKCAESCSDDGTQLTFCYGGAPYTVDCAKYGFSHCESLLDDDDLPYSACRP